MKNNIIKRILGVFILLIIITLHSNVFASEECPSDGYYYNANYDTVGKFGFKLEFVNSYDEYGTKMHRFKFIRSSSQCSEVPFDVYIDKTDPNAEDTYIGEITCSPMEIVVPDYDLEYNGLLPVKTLNLFFKSKVKFNDGELTGICADGSLAQNPTLSASVSSHSNVLGTVSNITINQTNKIDCSTMSFAAGSFEAKFCNAKSKAGSNDSVPSSLHTFKCSDEITDKILDPDKLKGEDYYVNKNYLYHSEEKTLNGDDYIFHYNSSQCGGDSGVSTTPGPSCTITCEEAVEAEYGPPVASKAGMCFEYKVRVTSRTNCYMTAISEPPSAEYTCCTPVPKCTSSSGKSYKQGGPNEDFDKCVKKCDGGKYSKSCSNKCYKEVYGDVIPGAKTNGYGEFYIASKMNQASSSTYTIASSEYFCYEDGALTWHGEGGGTSQYYANHSWGTGSKYIDGNNGIPRGDYGNGNICHDECHWEGCGAGTYLCPADNAQSDYEHNMETYNALIADCNGQSSCSTETATVSISVDYYDKKQQKHTIEFPYSRGKDSVTHNEGGSVNVPTDDDSILLPDDPNEGEGLLGCYKPGAPDTDSNLYRLTWSFPGTWINNKSGEISYTKQTGSCDSAGANCSWRNMKQKFCLPNNTGRVNADWWNAYYSKVIDEKNIETSTDVSEVKNTCLKSSSTVKTIINPGSATSPDEYNIHAITEKFGYFSWNIQMDCFYATNPTPLVSTDQNIKEEDVPEECKTAPDNYRIRSIDLENVFPATDGSETIDPGSYGRLPGHNWTKYSNPSAKDASYNNPNYFKSTSDPISYLSKIQADSEAIYDDKNIEYEFQISPKDIREIRKDFVGNGSSNNSFANFDEKEFYMDNNGVARYYSSDIRRYAKHINNNKNGGLACNNMQSYGSDACE